MSLKDKNIIKFLEKYIKESKKYYASNNKVDKIKIFFFKNIIIPLIKRLNMFLLFNN